MLVESIVAGSMKRQRVRSGVLEVAA